MASLRRAGYSGIVLSLVLLWCAALAPLPARAAADPSVQRFPACGLASGASNCASVCSAPQQAIVKDSVLPSTAPVPPIARELAWFDCTNPAATLRPTPVQFTGPPLYLRLHRLLD